MNFKKLIYKVKVEFLSRFYILNAKKLQKKASKDKKINQFILDNIEKKKYSYDLSICIPTYARVEKKKYLDYAIKKIDEAINFSQFKNYEVVIFDNCSDFNLDELVQKYNKLNIKLFKNDKKIEAHESIYNAVNLSSGKYIYIHMDDDYIDTKFFEDIKVNLDKGYEFMICRTKSVWDEDYDKTEFNWTWTSPNSDRTCEFVPSDKFIYYPVAASCMIFERKFFENYGVIPSIKNGIDLDLCFRVRRYVKKALFLYNSVNFYRFHPYQGSKNAEEDPQNFERLIWMVEKSNIVFKYFENQKQAQKLSILYTLVYALILDGKGRFDQSIDANIEFNNLDEWGKLQFGIIWSKSFFELYKKNLRFVDQFDIINRSLKILDAEA